MAKAKKISKKKVPPKEQPLKLNMSFEEALKAAANTKAPKKNN